MIRIAHAITFLLLAVPVSFAQAPILPPGEKEVAIRLESSPRHGEWATVTSENGDRIRAWVVYPERKDKAPVMIVIHEIFGLNDWARAVADQLAAEGFIAVAPDFLSGKAPDKKGSDGLKVDDARKLMGALSPTEVVSRLNAVASWATNLPAATKDYGVIGFCWGGGMSFKFAVEQPGLKAAVVYYGTSPSTADLARIKAPVLGLYGADDARVNATVPDAEREMKRLGKRYEVETYDGAGHAFLRQQDGRDGANLRASQRAWPRTIKFLKDAMSSGLASTVPPVPAEALSESTAMCGPCE